MSKYVLVASELEAVGSTYILLTPCNNSNFGGNCATWTGNFNTCYGVGEYNDAISSCKVKGGIVCRRCRNAKCKGAGPLITGPAYNLQEQNCNDVTSSIYYYFT
jgi:hypothetical protein